MKSTKAFYKSYDLDGWEGGIAVFVTYGAYGSTIVSIPRFGMSTVMIKEQDINSMLMNNKTMKTSEVDYFVKMITRDLRENLSLV